MAPSETSPRDSVAAAKPPLETHGRRTGRRARAWYVDVWVQLLRKKPLGTLGGAIVLVMLAAA